MGLDMPQFHISKAVLVLLVFGQSSSVSATLAEGITAEDIPHITTSERKQREEVRSYDEI